MKTVFNSFNAVKKFYFGIQTVFPGSDIYNKQINAYYSFFSLPYRYCDNRSNSHLKSIETESPISTPVPNLWQIKFL